MWCPRFRLPCPWLPGTNKLTPITCLAESPRNRVTIQTSIARLRRAGLSTGRSGGGARGGCNTPYSRGRSREREVGEYAYKLIYRSICVDFQFATGRCRSEEDKYCDIETTIHKQSTTHQYCPTIAPPSAPPPQPVCRHQRKVSTCHEPLCLPCTAETCIRVPLTDFGISQWQNVLVQSRASCRIGKQAWPPYPTSRRED